MLRLNEDRLFATFLSRHDWLAVAKDNNLDLSLSAMSSDIARKELAVRTAEGKPQVQLGVQYGQIQGGSSYTTGENKYVYVQASMPLYDSGYHASRKREAQALIQTSEQETRIKSLEIDKQVQELLANLSSSKERVVALRQAISSGEVYLELSQESYQLGLRNLLEVQRAKEKLYANQRDLLKTSLSMVSYVVQLYAVTAELDAPWVASLSQLLWED
jgi:outer membrane protein TolC